MNNEVKIVGIVSDYIEFDGKIGNEPIFYSEISIKRISSVEDVIPVLIPGRLIPEGGVAGKTVKVTGDFQSKNWNKKLLLRVFAKNLEILPEDELHSNNIFLRGFICKPTIKRQTPKGRIVADMMLAVWRNDRADGDSDYIPCISWDRNADEVEKYEVGDLITLTGRIQSRIYKKIYFDGSIEYKTAYEVSCSTVDREGNNNARLQKSVTGA